MRFQLLFIFLLLGLTLHAQKRSEKQLAELNQLFSGSELFSRIFTGFALYDPESQSMVFQKDADKYYTPASNTKIFTFYTALKIMADSIPALRYIEKGDSIIFWGTGNPFFLHPALPQDSSLLEWLRDSSRQLFFSTHNFKDERFGPGWAWDDYNDYYQAERSPFPIYGNIARFERDSLGEGFVAYPSYFQSHIAFNPRLDNHRALVQRREHANIFEYNSRALTGPPFSREVPFVPTPEVAAGLLADTLGRPVRLLDLMDVTPEDAKTLFSSIPDTLYRRLMQDSDNFIAEQLLLACSEKLTGTLNCREGIRYAVDSLFGGIPDTLVWRDGSGLSRYNLFTPRSIIGVLELIYRELPRERLLNIFPAGGVSGTIKDYYADEQKQPYVYAKTGTLANRHCLSGYLLAKSGKVYLFSFMNNNYLGSSTPVKKEMEKVLRYVRDNF
ncbi:MAG: D-alanyl-D-alanine carboxypeptidase [Phaeodactylibacter sp.]|nr:D-alanyl-D-alanine carboxypeptidase [Phaeodactylibacter sp.]MCB9047924.1 D-alanyl-D-alanine carboxypeptidase [Lewinellaceae bacterium]